MTDQQIDDYAVLIVEAVRTAGTKAIAVDKVRQILEEILQATE